MKKIFNEGNQIHNFMSSSGSGTVINYGSGSGSDILPSYGSGSGSTSQKVTVPTVPVPVPQHCLQVGVRSRSGSGSASKWKVVSGSASRSTINSKDFHKKAYRNIFLFAHHVSSVVDLRC
jgi:hypothetical protein